MGRAKAKEGPKRVPKRKQSDQQQGSQNWYVQLAKLLWSVNEQKADQITNRYITPRSVCVCVPNQ